MNTKLTLTIEESTVEKAKKYAEHQGRSLSGIIENYLNALTGDKSVSQEIKLSARVKSLQGSFKAPKNFDYKKALNKRLVEKYG